MPERQPIPLTPVVVALDGDDYREIAGWPFADPFVRRLLTDDLPRRVLYGNCRVWLYRDPDGHAVGFGSLDLCGEYQDDAGGRDHPYIPLLAVNPAFQRRGHAKTIVRHLIAQARALVTTVDECDPTVFLDVYTTSVEAIGLYAGAGFQVMNPQPISDPLQDGLTYNVMALRVSGESGAPTPQGADE